MGGEVSSCCGGSGDEYSVELTAAPNDINTLKLKYINSSNQGSQVDDVDAAVKRSFRKKLEDGLDVNLILQDKSRLTCQVRLDKSNEFLLLSCEKKARAIGMGDIKAILHTEEQLRRVESSAGITTIEICAAIHLAASGNCIPLFFTNPMDKKNFVSVVEEAKTVFNKKI